MKIRSRLSISLETLTQTVMPLADGDRVVFLQALRDWYLLHLSGIHESSKRGDEIRTLLETPLNEIPVTESSVAQVRTQLLRYRSDESAWTLSAAVGLIAYICILRDWNDCCINDEFDLEYVIGDVSGLVVKTCALCGYTLDTNGNPCDRPIPYRIALRSELVAAGVIENTS